MQQTVCQLENYNDSHTAAVPGKWYISGFPIEQIRKSVHVEKLHLGWIGWLVFLGLLGINFDVKYNSGIMMIRDVILQKHASMHVEKMNRIFISHS